jgi:hypothetical protein
MAAATLQRKCGCGGKCHSCGNDAPPSVRRVLATPGRPLDSASRAFFEPRFGHDFTRVAATQAPQKLAVGEAGNAFEQEADRWGAAASAAVAPAPRRPGAGGTAGEAPAPRSLAAIRVHDDAEAAESARAVTARAYTVGSHIVFNQGEYAPHTEAGRRLLAHELAHVGQQNVGTLQRSLGVFDPATFSQSQPKLTNAQLVQSWIDSLCGSHGWTVDPGLGVLSIANRAAFCGGGPTTDGTAPATPGYAGSKHPVSCKCLCDITAPGSPSVWLHTGDVFEAPDKDRTNTEKHDVTKEGQGATLDPEGKRTETHVGISGRAGWGVRGAGATAPAGGSGRGQLLQDPPWIIFAHEVCGHVVGPRANSAFGRGSHVQTPSGTVSAVDVENRIRREHSTVANNLGIRQGDARVEDPNDPSASIVIRGSYVTPLAGDTLRTVAARFGIATFRITWDIFRGEGDRFKNADAAIPKNEVLFIRGVFYHDVLSGETVEDIAKTWGIPLASLRRANPTLPATGAAPNGARLIIPAS